jgi:hypothetical protein
VLDDPLAYTEREIQPAVRRVSLLEMLRYAERMKVVVEAKPVLLEATVQSAFACMPEWRVTDIVDQSKRFGEILVQSQRCRDSPGDLRDFHRVGQTGTKVIGRAGGENLGLARESTKGPRLHNPLAIALKRGAMGVRRRWIHALEQRIA